jgi:mannan endo-1,4-beta-mannosidase
VYANTITGATQTQPGTALLFRPLVEMKGTDFVWWSDDGSTGAEPAMTYYPGSAYVDAVGIDVYDKDLAIGHTPGDNRGLTTYQDMVATGTGSFGRKWDARTLVERVRDSYPAMAFATTWYSSYKSQGKATFVYALSDLADVPQLMKDPLIKTLPASAP